jgi:hypothetical protein
MDATHLHCRRCGTVRPIRFEPLVAGEQSLGTGVYCGHCRTLAFTLLKPARFYCEICDDVRPALVERVEFGQTSGQTSGQGSCDFGVVLVCGGCFDGKAMLFAAATPSRFAGAAASERPAREPPSGRARRG